MKAPIANKSTISHRIFGIEGKVRIFLTGYIVETLTIMPPL